MAEKKFSKSEKTVVRRMCKEMADELLDRGHIPLFLVGGKEIGGGFRDYTVAGMPGVDAEYIQYVLGRLMRLMDGTAKRETESN